MHAPIGQVNRVLDLGTGTGIWCIDFADEHPESDVKGIDISPIQPSFVPPNCRFEVDDFNLEFLDDNKFDLIHQRDLIGCIPDGPVFYEKCFNALAPGGWLDGSQFPSSFLFSKLPGCCNLSPGLSFAGLKVLSAGHATNFETTQ